MTPFSFRGFWRILTAMARRDWLPLSAIVLCHGLACWLALYVRDETLVIVGDWQDRAPFQIAQGVMTGLASAAISAVALRDYPSPGLPKIGFARSLGWATATALSLQAANLVAIISGWALSEGASASVSPAGDPNDTVHPAILVVGLLLVLAVILLVSLRLSLATPVAAAQANPPVDAVKQSWKLTRRTWGMLMLISIAVGAPGLGIPLLLDSASPWANEVWTIVQSPLLGAAIGLSVTAFYVEASRAAGELSGIAAAFE